MNSNLNSLWSGFSASIIGSGHIKRGLPCQDASTVVMGPRPALIVCDGRGSASRSQDGASGAVRDFASQCAVFEPLLATILDADEADAGRWEQFCRILYRTLMQTKLNLSAEHNVPEKEFDFTVAAAVIGTNWIGCFQVGDGAIVLRQNGTVETAFSPDKGEFANQTHFLRENGEAKGKFHAKLFSAKENSGIAITSDGPEHLMFHLATMTPGKIFSMLFDDMQRRSLTKQDIMDYLTRREWDKDPRGQDDRSIAILAPELAQQEAAPEQEAPRPNVEAGQEVHRDRETPASAVPQPETVLSAPVETESSLPEHAARGGIEEKKKVPEPAVLPPSPHIACEHGKDLRETVESPEAHSESSWKDTGMAIPLSGGLACGAFLGMVLAVWYMNANLNLMREELHAVSARQNAAAELNEKKDRGTMASDCVFVDGDGMSGIRVRTDDASRPDTDSATIQDTPQSGFDGELQPFESDPRDRTDFPTEFAPAPSRPSALHRTRRMMQEQHSGMFI